MPDEVITETEAGGSKGTTVQSWEEVRAELESANVPLDTPETDEETISVETESASPATDSDSAEVKVDKIDTEVEERYSLKEPEKLRERLLADPELFKVVFGDPISDDTHIYHRPFADTQRNFHEKARRVLELERIVASIPKEAVSEGDVITAEMVDNGEATFAQFEAYKTRVSQQQLLSREQERLIEAERDQLALEEADFKNLYPNENIDDVYSRFSPLTKEGKPNLTYKPATLSQLRDIAFLEREGGIEAYVQKRLTPLVEEAKREAVKAVVSAKKTPHINSTDHDGAVTIPEIKAPRNAGEAEHLRQTNPDAYNAWAETNFPFLKGTVFK